VGLQFLTGFKKIESQDLIANILFFNILNSAVENFVPAVIPYIGVGNNITFLDHFFIGGNVGAGCGFSKQNFVFVTVITHVGAKF